jgi:hypothetical protein
MRQSAMAQQLMLTRFLWRFWGAIKIHGPTAWRQQNLSELAHGDRPTLDDEQDMGR